MKLQYLIVIGAFLVGCSAVFPACTRAQVPAPEKLATSVPVVMTGLDNLVAEGWAPLKGKNVGLITNQTSQTHTGEFGAHLFATQKSFHLVAFFSPEHGLLGERSAGVQSDAKDSFESVPVISLYGASRKPTPSMLKSINALVFDIQDVGVRPYTYLSTMILSMEAAAENGVPFYVLDRPNPLGGNRIEGNILDTSLRSFVGRVPVPYLHGMTLGELAKMAKANGWFHAAEKLDLTVIPMTGWQRRMDWRATGLTWVAPSPNVPHFENAVGLAMLGATGELGVLAIGIGTDMPFLRIGSNLMTTGELLSIAQNSFSGIGVASEDFTATTSAGTKQYHGVRLSVPATLDGISSLYEGQYRMLSAMMSKPAFVSSVGQLPLSVNTMYQKITGMYGLLGLLKSGRDITDILQSWRLDASRFRSAREPYLLYH